MAHSSLSSVADGSTNIFTVDFPYINKAYVKVYKDGAPVDPSTLTWPSAGQVQLPDVAASLAGKTILRKRESPLDAALATFLAGPLDVNALNTVISQMLHLAVEARDGYSGSSVAWRGAWSGTYSYAINDITSYGGSSYRSLVADNLNVTPGTDGTKWQLVASKGDVGTTAWADLTGVPSTFAPSAHDHNDIYYTEAEVNAAVGGRVSDAGDTMTGRLRLSYSYPDFVWGESGGAWRAGKSAASGAAGNWFLQHSTDNFVANFTDAITVTVAGAVSLIMDGTVRPKSYTVAGLPSASSHGAGAVLFVSNETGGATIAFSDGTNWRRVIDRAVVA